LKKGKAIYTVTKKQKPSLDPQQPNLHIKDLKSILNWSKSEPTNNTIWSRTSFSQILNNPQATRRIMIDYYFFHPMCFSHALLFPKIPFRLYNPNLSFSHPRVKKNEFFTNSDFIIRKPQKIGRAIWFFQIIKSEHRHPLNSLFFMVLMQFWLRNPNCTSTNSEHVCSMDSHFKDNISLPHSYLCVFG